MLDARWWPSFTQERVLLCTGRLPPASRPLDNKGKQDGKKDMWMVDSVGGVLQEYPGAVDKLRVTCPVLAVGSGIILSPL